MKTELYDTLSSAFLSPSPPPPITQSSTISALFPIFLVQKFGNLKKSRTFAPRLRDNATAQSGKGSLGEWLKPPVC